MSSPLMLRQKEMRDNLRTLFHTCSLEADIAAGLAWYPAARLIVREWAETYGESKETVACVIAALSPQQEWTRNLIQADDVLAKRPLSIRGLASNEYKARSLLTIKADTTFIYFPQGPKVYHFARNLAGDTGAVTIDTHALQAAFNDVTVTKSLRWKAYNAIAACYAVVAGELGYRRCDFQAIIWHTWKRLYPRMTKHKARNQWPSDDTID